MRQRSKAFVTTALFLALAAPAFAGIHYKSVTRMETASGRGGGETQAEGWAAGDKARVEFHSSANPITKAGTFLITKDGGKTVYLVDPEEKTYAVWDLKAMLGMAGGIMNGIGPLVKFQFTDPKVEKLLDEDGGTVAGLPTRHVRYRTSYTLTIKVLGMGNASDVVTDEDIWTTKSLSDLGLGIWLRSEPMRTGNDELDKLIASGREKIQGLPLKMNSVSTNTDKKKGKQSVTRTSMEVTQIDMSVSVPASSFEIPAGYTETQMMVGPKGRDR